IDRRHRDIHLDLGVFFGEPLKTNEQLYALGKVVGLYLEMQRSVCVVEIVVDVIGGGGKQLVLELSESLALVGRELVPLHFELDVMGNDGALTRNVLLF